VNNGRQFFSPLHIRHGKERVQFRARCFFNVINLLESRQSAPLNQQGGAGSPGSMLGGDKEKMTVG
jgi:hypothetical protein